MTDVQEIQLHIKGAEGPPSPSKVATTTPHPSPPPPLPLPPPPPPPPSSMLKHWRWWLMMTVNVFFLIVGQTVATLLGRLYYNKGGNSRWMATLVQSVGFPLLFLPLLLFPFHHVTPPTIPTARPHAAKIALIYVSLGLITAVDNLMYSYGLLYLPVSTYSLVCATQLAFNAVFSYFINSQKFTPLVFNSVVLLSFSAALLGVESNSADSTKVSGEKYSLGFILTLGASATYSLLLSLMQLTFQKVLKTETFSVVLEMQICTSFVATCATVVGLFASGEWRGLRGEMGGYQMGRVAYVMTLAWIAVAWQVTSIGIVGLVFVVSSLFSNVISTLALPVVPIFAVVFFHDRMDGVKVMAMLIAGWGFVSYIYQHYLDDSRAKKATTTDAME